MVSKRRPLGDISGSMATSIRKNTMIVIKDPKIVAEARRTDSADSSLLNSVTDVFPRITEKKLEMATAKVLTFIPPAVDWEPPPIHIKTEYTMIVSNEKLVRSTLLKPAVLGVTELKKDCTILSSMSMWTKALFHSKIAIIIVPKTTKMDVVTMTILVLIFVRC